MAAMQRDDSPKGTEPGTTPAADETNRRVAASRATLERLLLDNLVPFWTQHAIDREAGGYRLNHDDAGRDRGLHTHTLIAQARTLWFFTRLAASPYGTPEHRDLATHGFIFLRDALRGWGSERWDKVWWVQAEALFACLRLFRATDDPLFAEAYLSTLDWIDRHQADHEHGDWHGIVSPRG